MSASDRVPIGTSCQAKSGLRFVESSTCFSGSMTANAHSPGIVAMSANAVVRNFIARRRSSLLPMRRNRAVEIRQRLDARFPRYELRGQHAIRVQVRQLQLTAIHERDERIERVV